MLVVEGGSKITKRFSPFVAYSGSMRPCSTAMLYSLAFWVSFFCQARAAQSRAKDLPEPVGLSSNEFWPRCKAMMICNAVED